MYYVRQKLDKGYTVHLYSTILDYKVLNDTIYIYEVHNDTMIKKISIPYFSI